MSVFNLSVYFTTYILVLYLFWTFFNLPLNPLMPTGHNNMFKIDNIKPI